MSTRKRPPSRFGIEYQPSLDSLVKVGDVVKVKISNVAFDTTKVSRDGNNFKFRDPITYFEDGSRLYIEPPISDTLEEGLSNYWADHPIERGQEVYVRLTVIKKRKGYYTGKLVPDYDPSIKTDDAQSSDVVNGNVASQRTGSRPRNRGPGQYDGSSTTHMGGRPGNYNGSGTTQTGGKPNPLEGTELERAIQTTFRNDNPSDEQLRAVVFGYIP